MKSAKRPIAIIAAVVATVSAAGVTVHRSFRGGYPAAVSEARQNSAAGGYLGFANPADALGFFGEIQKRLYTA